MNDRPDYAAELKRSWNDPRAVLGALGLLAKNAQRQAGGFVVCCPAHGERTPSCSVQVRAGILQWHCFGCSASGDVLDLVAAVRGLDSKAHFPDVLRAAAELAGRWDILDALDGKSEPRAPIVAPPKAPPPEPEPERTPPPILEVAELWDAAIPIPHDAEVTAWVESRGLRSYEVHVRDLARALPVDAPHPRWARCRGQPWAGMGYRCLVPVFDAEGAMRSLRARRVIAGADGLPKALTPAGHTMRGLVMGNALASILLETGARPPWWGDSAPLRVVVAEGEPDYLTWALRVHDTPSVHPPAVFGIESGAWTDDIAARIPDGATVIVWTHHDAAGEKYAARVAETLGSRCAVMRGGVE